MQASLHILKSKRNYDILPFSNFTSQKQTMMANDCIFALAQSLLVQALAVLLLWGGTSSDEQVDFSALALRLIMVIGNDVWAWHVLMNSSPPLQNFCMKPAPFTLPSTIRHTHPRMRPTDKPTNNPQIHPSIHPHVSHVPRNSQVLIVST